MQTKEESLINVRAVGVNIKVGELRPSPWNRAEDGAVEIAELANSVAMHGILQPLIVRVIGAQEGYEIVAGHRRWRAAAKAGLKEVPCVLTHLNDQDAKVAQVTENLMRKDLNPVEEAEAFKALEEGAHTPQTISEMVGKPVKYVYRSLELLKLPEPALRALEAGLITAAHGHQLVRVGEKQMALVLKYALTKDYHHNCPTVEDLKHFIGQKIGKNLADAPWDKAVEYAGKVACKGCPYNSGNQGSLFDGAEGGHCTNGACFTVKLTQFYKDLQAKGAARWPMLKFVGMAASSYGDIQVIKGHQVVEEKDPKVVKSIREGNKVGEKQVEGFGFGILKPSNWGTAKAAKLVVLKKMPEGAKQTHGGYVEPTPEERYHSWYVREATNMMMEPHEKAFHKRRVECEKQAEAAWRKDKKAIIEAYEKKERKDKPNA
jgi:ParB/RepB/Spo0J family partition protein